MTLAAHKKLLETRTSWDFLLITTATHLVAQLPIASEMT